MRNILLSQVHLRKKATPTDERGGRLFTIIQTAKANALIAEKYIEYLLENINKVPVEDLLPWSEKLPKELSIKQYIR